MVEPCQKFVHLWETFIINIKPVLKHRRLFLQHVFGHPILLISLSLDSTWQAYPIFLYLYFSVAGEFSKEYHSMETKPGSPSIDSDLEFLFSSNDLDKLEIGSYAVSLAAGIILQRLLFGANRWSVDTCFPFDCTSFE